MSSRDTYPHALDALRGAAAMLGFAAEEERSVDDAFKKIVDMHLRVAPCFASAPIAVLPG